MKTITTIVMLLLTTLLYSQKVVVDEEKEIITVSSKYIIKSVSFRIYDNIKEGKRYEDLETFEVNKKTFKIDANKLREGVDQVLIDYGDGFVTVNF